MKYILLFEELNVDQHLSDRGVDPKNTRVITDEESGDAFFFLYNLSGQMVGYQKYNNNYQKKGQRRSDDPKKVKYYNWVGDEDKNKKIAVWGLETYNYTDKYLFITEGIFDIIRAHEAGYPGIAVLCNNPSDQLKNWLKTLPQKKIVIYDNDGPGQKLKQLGDYSFSVENGKDLNDMSQEDAKIFLDEIILDIESKRINESNEIDLYEEINEEEYNSLLLKFFNSDPLNINEINRIKISLKEFDIVRKNAKMFEVKNLFFLRRNGKNISVIKKLNDDYYAVSIISNSDLDPNRDREYIDFFQIEIKDLYFKCDTLEGVIQLYQKYL